MIGKESIGERRSVGANALREGKAFEEGTLDFLDTFAVTRSDTRIRNGGRNIPSEIELSHGNVLRAEFTGLIEKHYFPKLAAHV